MACFAAAISWKLGRKVTFDPKRESFVNDTEANGCLFVVPKSHEQGRIDISALIAAPGGRPRGAIPVEAAPGDVLVHSRNLVHGSFANTSPDPRVTVYFGYHARATVAGIYEEAHIERRRQAIALAVWRLHRK